MVPENASVNLNSTTKASAAKASRARQEFRERADRGMQHARERASRLRVAASARADCSGSVATSAVTVPISTSAAITT